MNINYYEKLEADPKFVEKVAFNIFYAEGRANNPHFSAMWVDVPQEEKQRCGTIGMQAIHALVDDYTTPSCQCNYCRSGGKEGHGRPIMCRQRWEKIPAAQRTEISESCSE